MELKRTINPDEAVAYGAAAYAFSLVTGKDTVMEEFVLQDVIPLSIGIENKSREMGVIIPRNTTIPTKKWNNRQTLKDNQEKMILKIFEGERALTKENHFLGAFTISGIPPAPRKEGKVRVLFEINASGILHVKAIEKITGNLSEITIARDKGRLSEREIKQMVREAEKFRQKDEELKQRSKAMNALEDFAYSVKDKMSQKYLTTRQKESLMSKVTEILHWLDINKKEPVEMSHLEAKKKELEQLWND